MLCVRMYDSTYVNCVGVLCVLCVRMYDSMTYKATYVNCVVRVNCVGMCYV